MPTAHLTDIVVSRLKAPGTCFDETTPAFGIRVGTNRKITEEPVDRAGRTTFSTAYTRGVSP